MYCKMFFSHLWQDLLPMNNLRIQLVFCMELERMHFTTNVLIKKHHTSILSNKGIRESKSQSKKCRELQIIFITLFLKLICFILGPSSSSFLFLKKAKEVSTSKQIKFDMEIQISMYYVMYLACVMKVATLMKKNVEWKIGIKW